MAAPRSRSSTRASCQHAELANRLLPGYDFITDPATRATATRATTNPRDEGDWVDEGACGGFPAHPSSWHGTFVTGIMAADINNGIGMSGIDLFAQVVPVRVLGECGGTDEDVFEGMLWASGVQIAGVPPNPFPAKVINMSLGGPGGCPNAVQDAIDDALAQGSVVVVAAGNESSDAWNFAPSGCSGVITVGATNRAGDLAFYSNFGRRVDISAPGGDFDDGGIVSLSNDGQTVPGNDAYASAIGTSAAAPHVSGVVSMMLARDPTLTPGRVLSILQGTAREFPAGLDLPQRQRLRRRPPRRGTCAGEHDPRRPRAAGGRGDGRRVLPRGTSTTTTTRPIRSRSCSSTRNPLAKNKRTGFFFFAWTDPSRRRPARSPCASSSATAALSSTRTTTPRTQPNARSSRRIGRARGRS